MRKTIAMREMFATESAMVGRKVRDWGEVFMRSNVLKVHSTLTSARMPTAMGKT